MQEFDAKTAILNYVAGQGPAPEDKIIRYMEDAETEHYERLGIESFDCVDVSLLLFKLVQEKRLNWREPPGGDALGTKPLLYSIYGRSAKIAAHQAK